MSILWLTAASFGSWFLSTLAGGGTPLLLIPVIGYCLGTAAIPPVLTVGMLFGHPQRLVLYWQAINWRVTFWYLPGAIAGAGIGALIFSSIQLEWLPIFLALILIFSTLTYSSGSKVRWATVATWYFLPAGFIFAFISGLLGSAGPLLNPLYLNYGLKKEELIGTKSANLLIVHLVKIITYSLAGALNPTYWGYGLILGLAALPGNWLGHKILKQVSEKRFRQLLVSFVLFSGMLILWQEIFSSLILSDQF